MGFILVGLMVYWPILGSFFLSDDFIFLADIHEFGIQSIWTVFPRFFFRPIIMLSFWLDYRLWEFQSWGYHLTNLLFHVANACLVTWIAKYWLERNQCPQERISRFAPLAGLLFLVHSRHTEAVSWISGRSYLIATFFILLSLTSYFHDLRKYKRCWIIIAWLFYGLALLSKESVITLPLIILILEFYLRPPSGWFRRCGKVISGYVVVMGLYFIFRKLALGEWIGGHETGMTPLLNEPLWLRNLIFYTTRTMIPASDWKIHSFVMVQGKRVLILAGILMAISWIIYSFPKLKNYTFFRFLLFPGWMITWIVLYLVSLLPVLDIMNLNIHLGSFMGERLIYWPSVMIVLLLILGIEQGWRNWYKTSLSVLLVLSLFHGIALFRANRIWLEAGQISQTLVQELCQFPLGKRLVILNVPDTLRGSYIFRNGLLAIQRIWHVPFESLDRLTFQYLHSSQDCVVVQILDAKTYAVRTDGDQTYFIKANQRDRSDSLQITTFNRTEFHLRRQRIDPDTRMIFYAGGHFHLLP